MAAVEVTSNGHSAVGARGVAPLPTGLTREGEVSDPEGLGEVLRALFGEHKLSKQVRIGVANQRVVVRTLRMPLIADPKELETAVRFQARDHVPMPLEQAVIDWQVVAQGIGEDRRQMDIVVVAARRDMVGTLVQAVTAAGLKPIGIDVSAFGMIRALSGGLDSNTPLLAPEPGEEATAELGEPAQPVETARLFCNLGDSTNLAVARGTSCLFTRLSTFGLEGVAQRLAERRGLTLEHARQWIAHVGLERPPEAIEGDPALVAAAREVLAEGASKLADEMRLSLDFYGAQEGAVAVDEVIAGGAGTSIEGLPARLERELGYRVHVVRPDGLSGLDAPAAARLTLAYGLALEE